MHTGYPLFNIRVITTFQLSGNPNEFLGKRIVKFGDGLVVTKRNRG